LRYLGGLMNGQDWMAKLALAPHPEGGFYRRIYTDTRQVDTPRGRRAAATSIHYLLTRAAPVGFLHRNASTILHYLQHGGPVEYVLLPAPGVCRRIVLGHGCEESLFLEVPGGCWKASRLLDAATHALVSEVVVPGFDPADHAFMRAEELRRDYPQHADQLMPLLRAASAQ
jgi:uncharacterized protein